MAQFLDKFGDLDDDALIREGQLAERWDKAPRTLQRWRAEGYGPPYLTIGGSVRYRVGDVRAFEARQRRGGGAVR